MTENTIKSYDSLFHFKFVPQFNQEVLFTTVQSGGKSLDTYMQDYKRTQSGAYLLRTPSSVSARRVDFKLPGPEFYMCTDTQVNEQLA